MEHFYRYLPLNDELRARSLYVIAGGYTRIPPDTPYPPSHHPKDHDFRWRRGRTLQEYQLIYITRGGGMFESKTGGPRPIEAGDLFMLYPGEWHRYSPESSTGWDEYWVAFQGSFAERMVADHALSPAKPILRIGVDAGLIEEFLRLTQEIGDEAIGYQNIIAARTMLILAHATASTLRQNYEGTEILRTIERAKCLLLEQADRAVNIERMAHDLGIGYSQFRRAFREYTGLSPSQYHLQIRINHACELLRTTTLPIGFIGERTGFGSAYYFARIFREKTGATPREYRTLSQRHTEAPADT